MFRVFGFCFYIYLKINFIKPVIKNRCMKGKNKMKKVLSFVLALVMAFAIININVSAAISAGNKTNYVICPTCGTKMTELQYAKHICSNVVSVETYTLTINYVDENGNEVAQQYTAQVDYGTEYEVASPDVDNMHLVDDAQVTIDGTMPAEDVTVDVIYALDEYTLTINYVDDMGAVVAPAYTATLTAGTSYSQVSPAVTKMHLVDDVQAIISGTMPAEDVIIYVVYTADVYTLTINYVDEDGTPVSDKYSSIVEEGVTYSQESPEVTGYHFVNENQATVSGTMPAADITVDVVYAIDEYTLTINYVDEDGNEVATTYEQDYATGAEYSVESPAVANMYLIDDAQATISDTMPAEDVIVDVIYTVVESTETIVETTEIEKSEIASVTPIGPVIEPGTAGGGAADGSGKIGGGSSSKGTVSRPKTTATPAEKTETTTTREMRVYGETDDEIKIPYTGSSENFVIVAVFMAAVAMAVIAFKKKAKPLFIFK